MPDHPSDKIWDEYDWERFLQQQELRTEKYMELLEKYLNHPRRDELIAQEMGWTHLLSGDARDWEEEVDAQFEQQLAEEEAEGTPQNEAPHGFTFERHPLYRLTVALGMELDELFNSTPAHLREHPAAITIRSQVTLAAAKLAAALNDDDVDELGMTIAYLKRAVFAINSALEAGIRLQASNVVSESAADKVRDRLFEIRNGIVSTMGDFRAEFRRRHLK